MSVYYLDTSALVKRYVQEQGTGWIADLADPLLSHELYTVRLTGPELVAALFRKVRSGAVSRDAALQAAQAFRLDWKDQYQVVEIADIVTERAMDLAQTHGLRGYDAVHLAAALMVDDAGRVIGASQVIFVSADDTQRQAAADEGMLVENPNEHR